MALEYALRYPASLSHLVLLNTGGDARWERQNAAALLARRSYSPKKAELVRRWFSGQFAPREYFPMFLRIGAVYHIHFGRWLVRDLIDGAWRSKVRPEALIFAGRDLLNGWTVMDRLGEITVPTLVMADRDDGVFPPECQRELAAGIPGARLHPQQCRSSGPPGNPRWPAILPGCAGHGSCTTITPGHSPVPAGMAT